MNNLLKKFDTVTLEEMKKVKLMNRTDTKYVTSLSRLKQLLSIADCEYMVQIIEGEKIMPYYTKYFDTPDCRMYYTHLHGKKSRQKVRVRRYESSNQAYLEVKLKNNKGRTRKMRVNLDEVDPQACADFITEVAGFEPEILKPNIENRFSRITLVNRNMTERITIDYNLQFHNIVTDNCYRLDDIVIIELKRNGREPSPIVSILRNLRIKQSGFSKYCIGMALTNPELKTNLVKERLRMINKITN